MRKFVVDASVALKWYIPEVHSGAAIRLLDEEIVLCAPDLIGAELTNVLWKKIRRGEISASEADEILAAFSDLPIEITPAARLLPSALHVAVSLDRGVYDSLYISLAVAEQCAVVTADRKLHATVSASTLAPHVVWVEDEF